MHERHRRWSRNGWAACARPWRFSAVASSMSDLSGTKGSEIQAGELRGANDIFANHVTFEVDAVADLHGAQVRMLERIWDDLYVEPVGPEARDREADPVDRYRSFRHDVGRQL